MKKPASLLLLFLGLSLFNSALTAQNAVLNAESFRHYIDTINASDTEFYKEYITNDGSWAFMADNIPLFECPDKELELTYYFRWWTFRKHIKQTPGGFVITEFLPDVPWAGKYNTISCAAAFHFYEGRWLHNPVYLDDYAKFWFRGGGSISTYSFWCADALYKQYLVTGDKGNMKEFLPDMIRTYEDREKVQYGATGLFWQNDGNDGMEMSVCGSGYRATINSYMYGDARAIATISSFMGDKKTSERFNEKADAIKKKMLAMLWDPKDTFFKVLPRDPAGSVLCGTRELHGYSPWLFDIPGNDYSAAWRFLMDPAYFYAPYGLTTAEQVSKGFNISYEGHECQWNGPSWPYATTVTLLALANLLNDYKQDYVAAKDYFTLLMDYSSAQRLRRGDGTIVPWIDENLNPFTGDWIARTRLKSWENGNWSEEKGGIERGKDYNHSAFCDLVITGLVGLRPQPDNSIIINPLLPQGSWEYFCLDNILYHGKILTILYDKTGTRYGRGKGFQVLVNGSAVARSENTGLIRVAL